jgi:prepilin-type N-terminal cleavage/methylation domain-containing protein
MESAQRQAMNDEGGFTLIELLISMCLLLVVSGIVLGATMDLTRLSGTMTNRSDMHAGVRNATALLQQEVGQAGRVSLPGPVTLLADVGIGVATVQVSSTEGMFVGERLIIGTGVNEETVTVTDLDPDTNSIEANFTLDHIAGARVATTGGFSGGVIPTTMANGSDDMTLKIMGDINANGRMVYVEYRCDLASGRLFRNVMAFDAPVKPAVTVEQVLLDNLLPNPPDPDGTVPPCFIYDQRTFSGTTFVIGVAVMTTVRTQELDIHTNAFQRVTKALLNVSPRNVVNVWQLASLDYRNRIQPIPPTVLALLPQAAQEAQEP